MSVQQTFNETVRAIEKIYGRGMKTNIQLIEIAKNIFPMLGNNVFRNMEYQFDKMKGKFSIINTDNGNGEHWLATFQRGKNIYVFDSFGRPTKNLIPVFYKRAIHAGYTIIDTDYDADQRDEQVDCGIRALSWCIICHFKGIKYALKI